MGDRRLPPPGPDPPAPGRPVPAVPVKGRPGHRDPGRRLRRGRVREPLPVADRSDPGEVADAAGPSPAGRASGRCEVVCFTADHGGALRPAARQPRPHRGRGLGRPHRGAGRAGRRRAGVPVREPGRGDRRHPAPPARPDLRLPVRDAADARHAGRRPAPTGSATGGNLFATSLAAERRRATRVVGGRRDWVAFVPFAARWPFEVHLFPHRHLPDLPALDEAERDGLPPLYLDLLRPLRRALRPAPALHAAWHQAPVRRDRDLAHVHLEAFSVRRSATKLKYLASSESGCRCLHQRHRPRAGGRAAARRKPSSRLNGERTGRAGGGGVPGPGRARPGRRLGGAGAGQLDRRAHRLQRRLRAPGGDRPAGAGRGRAPGRRAAAAVVAAGGAAGRPGAGRRRPGAGRGLGRLRGRGGLGARAARAELAGADLVVDGDLPAGSGLSSSAALECATAPALADLHGARLDGRPWPGWPAGPRTRSSACRPGSWTRWVGAAGGPGTPCSSTPARWTTEHVPFDPAAVGLTLLVIDTRAGHRLVDGAYAERRAACEAAAAILGVPALRDATLAHVEAAAEALGDRGCAGPATWSPRTPGSWRRWRCCGPATWTGWARSGRLPRLAARRLRGLLARARRRGRGGRGGRRGRPHDRGGCRRRCSDSRRI